MATQSSETLIPGLPTERRPAIWPWLVMPLVTLALFYSLDQLHKAHGRNEAGFGGDSDVASSPVSPGESGSQ